MPCTASFWQTDWKGHDWWAPHISADNRYSREEYYLWSYWLGWGKWYKDKKDLPVVLSLQCKLKQIWTTAVCFNFLFIYYEHKE